MLHALALPSTCDYAFLLDFLQNRIVHGEHAETILRDIMGNVATVQGKFAVKAKALELVVCPIITRYVNLTLLAMDALTAQTPDQVRHVKSRTRNQRTFAWMFSDVE